MCSSLEENAGSLAKLAQLYLAKAAQHNAVADLLYEVATLGDPALSPVLSLMGDDQARSGVFDATEEEAFNRLRTALSQDPTQQNVLSLAKACRGIAARYYAAVNLLLARVISASPPQSGGDTTGLKLGDQP